MVKVFCKDFQKLMHTECLELCLSGSKFSINIRHDVDENDGDDNGGNDDDSDVVTDTVLNILDINSCNLLSFQQRTFTSGKMDFRFILTFLVPLIKNIGDQWAFISFFQILQKILNIFFWYIAHLSGKCVKTASYQAFPPYRKLLRKTKCVIFLGSTC